MKRLVLTGDNGYSLWGAWSLDEMDKALAEKEELEAHEKALAEGDPEYGLKMGVDVPFTEFKVVEMEMDDETFEMLRA